jgi:hypothetical protein
MKNYFFSSAGFASPPSAGAAGASAAGASAAGASAGGVASAGASGAAASGAASPPPPHATARAATGTSAINLEIDMLVPFRQEPGGPRTLTRRLDTRNRLRTPEIRIKSLSIGYLASNSVRKTPSKTAGRPAGRVIPCLPVMISIREPRIEPNPVPLASIPRAPWPKLRAVPCDCAS